ncbi:protein farnesyltransferase alpha subunit, putative [Theileria equi strain WA]|uniref:Protein farnesyltransferase/geranylgeranyltransferase type-1 subunit alpha n=1 Tax=Theileria equi strain WA TaxID=1537102 RepID=L1LD59_THEEQ|nr:protein farnesyltransferase alpha subunit, putative [Theileria equi strain WA]EKX73214.1 protein farnesyltransferase alpha subunit, putative [Theileria equi strain WA]|eukprot:XP_004832666.1 protein farnesyltransferase alpha subunit, putative [Theileria equi strain WA]
MENAIALLEEYEGVNTLVTCKELNFPGEPFDISYDMLNDESVWEDLFYDDHSTRSSNGPFLFEISKEVLDERVDSLMRKLIKRREYSTRGLYITTILIKLNPANYTAWYYRNECINRLNISLEDELDFTRKITLESIKSYQPWNHRRNICQLANNCFNELEYIKLEIATSPKNQCAWSHLTWLVDTFGIDEDGINKEIEFIDFLIGSDSYNNSVWNYKNFIIKRFKDAFGLDYIVKECKNNFELLMKKPKNESLVNYMTNMLSYCETLFSKCINLDFCTSTCNGPPTLCIISAIVKSRGISTQLLTLVAHILQNQSIDQLCNKDEIYNKIEVLFVCF